jgi:hypothetical protein
MFSPEMQLIFTRQHFASAALHLACVTAARVAESTKQHCQLLFFTNKKNNANFAKSRVSPEHFVCASTAI